MSENPSETQCNTEVCAETKCAEVCATKCDETCATKCAETKCDETKCDETKCAEACKTKCDETKCDEKCATKCAETCKTKCDDTKRCEEKVTLSVPCKLSIRPQLLKTVDIPNPNIEITEKVFHIVVDKMQGKPISQMNIVEVVVYAMRTVEKIKRGKDILNNMEKKAIVMNIIQRFVRETSMDPEVKIYLTDIFIPTLLEGVIESLCALDVHETVTSCFPCCKKK